MPYSDTNTFATLERLGLKAGYLRILDSLGERAARRDVYRKTVAELQALSDRDLADFGFHRSEIPEIARQEASSACA